MIIPLQAFFSMHMLIHRYTHKVSFNIIMELYMDYMDRSKIFKLKINRILLGWPKSLFGFFCNILQKNLNELFGQPSTTCGRRGFHP